VNPAYRANALVWNVDPVLLRIGSVEVRYYSVLLAIAVVTTLLMWRRRALDAGMSESFAERLIVFATIGAFLGARVADLALYHSDRLVSDPLSILRIWQGGLASHGAIVGVTAACLALARFDFSAWRRIADIVVPASVLGSCFVRLGNFINSEIVGRPTDLPWGVVFPARDQLARHPVQLYEIIVALATFIVIRIAERRTRLPIGSGLTAGVGLSLYLMLRFLTEFVKAPSASAEAASHDVALTTAQLFSAVLIAPAILLLLFAIRRRPYEIAR
jgi:prolipoprotein diacylglyceryl transferase